MQDTYLIIVGRLGKKDSAAGLNRTRLQQIEEYVGRKFTSKLLLAEGPRVNGLGRVEIYIEGRLAYVMPLATNARLFCPTPVG